MTEAHADGRGLARQRARSRCHRGHAAVCDAGGGIVAAWGDPAAVILPRSSCKMLQALPLLESGAGAGLDGERLALACASHQGGGDACRAGGALARRPRDVRSRPALRAADARRSRRAPPAAAADEAPCQLHNNCSGKHAGFLMLGRRLGAGPEYVEIDHPVQRAVRAAFEEMCGAESPGWGIDGCSAPNFATTVTGLARAMARMADPRGLGPAREDAARRLVAAMVAHPLLVAGEGRACSELMPAMDGARRGQDRRRGGLCRDPARARPRRGAEDRGRRHPGLGMRHRGAAGAARRDRRRPSGGGAAAEPADPEPPRRTGRRDPPRPGVLRRRRRDLSRRRRLAGRPIWAYLESGDATGFRHGRPRAPAVAVPRAGARAIRRRLNGRRRVCPKHPRGRKPCRSRKPSTTRSGTPTWCTRRRTAPACIYIDRHLVHEVTSPQAFEGLRMAGRKVRAPEKTVAVPDHNVPTDVNRARGIENAGEPHPGRHAAAERRTSSASSSTTSPTCGRGSCTSSAPSRG